MVVSPKSDDFSEGITDLTSEGIGLSNDDDIVGEYRDRAGFFHAFLLENGRFSTVDPPFAAPSWGCAATEINADESCADFKKANAGNLQGIPPNKAGAAFFLSRHGYGDDPGAWPLWVGAGRQNGDDKRAFLETIAKRLTVAAVASGSLDLEEDNEGEWYLT